MALRDNYFRIDRVQTKAATFATDATIEFDRAQAYGTDSRHAPVKLVGEMTVALCEAGDVPDGSLERVEADGGAVVNFQGAVPFKAGTGATAGTGDITADGSGGIIPAASAGTGMPKRIASVVNGTAWILL